jgi:NDP-sugar pyrophosphorylase family protein
MPRFKAAILAAGEGSRLRAEGVTTPKALVEVGGEPLIARVARQLASAGASELVAIVHPRAAAAESLLRERLPAVPLTILLRETPSSFHSLLAILPGLAGAPFLMSLVDSVFDPGDLAGFVAAAEARPEAMAGLALTDHIADESPLRVALGPGDRIRAIGEKAASSGLVTGGVYWWSTQIAPAARAAEAQGIFRLRNFLSLLVERGDSLFGYRFGKMVDCDTLEDLRAAQEMR